METKHILIIGLIILTSGCTELSQDTGNQVDTKGLEIESFTVSDDRLRPEQQAIIRADFKNYHSDIEVHEVEIFNEGSNLNVSQKESQNGCTPSKEDLEGAREGVYPRMQCTWTVEAPEEDALEGFSERREPLKLRVSYNGSLENRESLEVEFRDVTDIESTSTVSRSFSNGEISAEMITETPIEQNTGNSVELKVDNVGPGRVDGGYSFEYTPEEVFEGCDSEGDPQIGSEWSSVCTLSSESRGVQNLFFSTDYKYVKEPNLDITVVNRR